MTRAKVNSGEISQIRRISDKFRHGLVLQAIRNKLAGVGIELTPFYWVQEGINPTEVPVIKGTISEYMVRFLEDEEMKIIVEKARGYSEEELLSWLNEGRRCLALLHFENIASFMWINLKECKFKPIAMHLNEDEAYLTDMHTLESYRGKNLAPYLRYQSYDILKNMGRNKIYSVSEFFNSSAIKYKHKLNARNLKLVLFIQLFNKLKWSFTLKTY